MSRFLEIKVSEIEDDTTLALIRELEQACPVSAELMANQPLLLFLTQCIYPEGAGKRVPITTKFVPSAPVLESRVGKLPEGALRDLCGELAMLAQSGLEVFSGSQVYALLNKTLPKYPGAGGASATRQRWDAVVNRRRANR